MPTRPYFESTPDPGHCTHEQNKRKNIAVRTNPSVSFARAAPGCFRYCRDDAAIQRRQNGSFETEFNHLGQRCLCVFGNLANRNRVRHDVEREMQKMRTSISEMERRSSVTRLVSRCSFMPSRNIRKLVATVAHHICVSKYGQRRRERQYQ
jgi:hypothetical protein